MKKPDDQDEEELKGIAHAIADAVTRQFGEPEQSAVQNVFERMNVPKLSEPTEVDPEAEDVDVD